MAWTNLTFAFGSLLTSTKMTQMYDNFAALAAGDSGAPNVIVDGSNITSGAITRAKLSTGTSGASGTGSIVTITLTAYSFFPRISGSGGSTVDPTGGGGSPDSPAFQISGLGGSTYDVDWRYIAA